MLVAPFIRYDGLERFTDLKLHTFGLRCGLSSIIAQANAHSQFQPGDVVICEFSSLIWLEEGKKKQKWDELHYWCAACGCSIREE
jgi:hypothetical protein